MAARTRREFLKQLGTISVWVATRPVAAAARQAEAPFEVLAVGDSLIWGQGLLEKDKFYKLTADWLGETMFRTRGVNLKVKAHSGSTLKFHKDEAEKYARVGRAEEYFFRPEVNVGFPSVYRQIELAADEYRAAGKGGADLIIAGGGITDMTTSRVFDPNGDDAVLRAGIQKYCRDDLYDVIARAAELHPRAKILVIGYFPAITEYSRSSKLLNAWLEALSFPRPLKFVANNPLGRKIFFEKLRKRAIVRSKIWLEESDRAMRAAVDRLNALHSEQRAWFVASPLTAEDGVEAPKTKLFRMSKGGHVNDPLARSREQDCREALPKLKKETGIVYPVRLCEIAAIGHPDPAGSRAYAEAIKHVLRRLYPDPT
jgi:hypothetical protein